MEWNYRLPGGPLPPELLQWLQEKGYHDFDSVAAFLAPGHYNPAAPTDIPDLLAGVDLLLDAIDKEEKILIWGDFDVDGQTATTMLVEALTLLKADFVVHIPNRVDDSHGVQLYRLRELIAEEAPQFMIVCDTGSAENEGIAFAKEQGLRVLISDHHEIANPPPPADILVNPLRLPERHPLRTISGAGITYLLLQALFLQIGRPQESRRFLDLLALGLVADVVDLVADTRYLLQLGMEGLRRTERPGLRYICEDAYINLEQITSTDIGFRIAPLLNSLGRLASAMQGVELLSTRDAVRARLLASEAKSLNEQRKMLTEQMTRSALELIEANPSVLSDDFAALVLSSPDWNASIVGIVAARLVELYGKPTALLVEDEAGNARGSIRSVPGFHVSHALDYIGDILDNYGGHELAGGLSIRAEHLHALRRRLSQAFVATAVPVEDAMPEVAAELPLDRVSLDFAYQVQRLGPFGQGNPLPKFKTSAVSVVSIAKLGKKGQHQRLIVQDNDGVRRHAFWWNSSEKPTPSGVIDLIYELGVSYFKDIPDVQMTLQSWEQVEAPEHPVFDNITWVDCRQDNPGTLLKALKDHPDLMIWVEGIAKDKSPGVPYSELGPAKELLIYTAPASQSIINKAIEKVEPETVYLLATPPPPQDLKTVMYLLRGLIQTVIKRMEGNTHLQKLAERLAVPSALVRSALLYLDAKGEISVDIGSRGKVFVHLQLENSERKQSIERYRRDIEEQWEEVEAYRRYLQRVEIGAENGFLSGA